MNAIKHSITHIYQPTSTSCGYASLSMLLSHFNRRITIENLLEQVPQACNEKGEPIGSLTAQLAGWCLRQGFRVDFISFDFLITDLSWAGLDNQELLKKLESVKNVRDIHNVGGKHWSREYVQAYIDLVMGGGELSIRPHITSQLLYEWLKTGPIFVNILSSVVHGTGRARYPESETSKRLRIPDDINGTVGTHSVVIYGNDSDGNFLVGDPWDGLGVINVETMLCAITAAELECDSQCFRLVKVS